MFFFRADGNKKIGAGHMMRCLTIAEALREMLKGNDGEPSCGENAIMFVCADEDSARLAEDYGFVAKVLNSDYRSMEAELSLWQEIMGPMRHTYRHTILVDSYYVTAKYLQELRSYGKVVLLDDMQQEAYPVDVVINYNAFASIECYESLYRESETKICVGSSYVPVRKQFLNRDYAVKKNVERVLITTGGGDVDNIAGAILNMLMESETGQETAQEIKKNTEKECKKINYDLIIGKYNPHRSSFLRLAEEYSNIQLHTDVKDMAGLMEQCDLAITAGGTTVYELAAIGVPFICFSYAENQELLTEYIGREGIAGYAGAYHKDAKAMLGEMKHIFKELRNDTAKRNACYLKEKHLIDGLGAGRIVKDALL